MYYKLAKYENTKITQSNFEKFNCFDCYKRITILLFNVNLKFT